MSVVVNVSHVVFHVNSDSKIIYSVKNVPGSFDYFKKLAIPYKD